MARRQRRRRKERRREHAQRRGWQTRHSVITGAGIAATATLGITAGAQAQSEYFYVGSNADTAAGGDCSTYGNTDCTLRDAIDAANTNAGFLDYVVFTSNVSGTVTLANGDLSIDDPVRIYGRGPDVDTVSGNEDSRIFDIDMTATGAEVGIYGLTLSDGAADYGGAINNNNSDLTVAGSVLSGNTAYMGGAIYEAGGSEYGMNLAVAYSSLIDNNAIYEGGAIFGSSSAGIVGGSTISGNDADEVGGAIHNNAGGFGVRLFDSTISGNTAEEGGGIVTFYGYAYNTIVANNSASTDPDTFNFFLLGVGSLIEQPGSTVNGYSNITGVDPQLGGLADNGGSTPTLKPAASSPVVDQGYSYAYYDQRGSTRIVDNPFVANEFPPPYGAADIGAVELTLAEGPQPPGPGPGPAPTPAPTFNLKKAIKKCKKKFPGEERAKKRKKCIKRARKKARRTASGVRFAAPAIKRWRAQAKAHTGARHWGDAAWKFDG
jgi:CSLREA domain-containing protein